MVLVLVNNETTRQSLAYVTKMSIAYRAGIIKYCSAEL